jgi:predicted nucleotidyltransferase
MGLLYLLSVSLFVLVIIVVTTVMVLVVVAALAALVVVGAGTEDVLHYRTAEGINLVSLLSTVC